MENIVEVVVVCVVGMLLSFLAGLTHKYLLQRYAQLERLRQPLLPGRGGSGLSRRKYGSQHRLGSNYSFDSAPTAAALIPKVGPAQAPTTPTAAHSSQMSNYSSGASNDSFGGNKNRSRSMSNLSEVSSVDSEMEYEFDWRTFFTDYVVIFYLIIILFQVYSAVLSFLEVMNPIRCDQSSPLLNGSRGTASIGSMGVEVYVVMAGVITAQYNILTLTDQMYDRTQRYIRMRFALVLFIYIGVICTISITFFFGEIYAGLIVDCVFVLCLSLSAAVQYFYVPWVLKYVTRSETILKIKIVSFFMCMTMLARGVIYWPGLWDTGKLTVLLNVIIVHVMNSIVLTGTVVILRISSTPSNQQQATGRPPTSSSLASMSSRALSGPLPASNKPELAEGV
jgi:hypothetical protein